MTFTPAQVLLILSTVGLLMLLGTRRGSTAETVAAILTVAPLIALVLSPLMGVTG